MTNTLPDEQLVEKALAGCGRSFEELARRHQVRVRHYLGRHNSDADADDLTQETFLRAYRFLDRYDARWRFSTWLLTIARRLSMNHGENRRRHATRFGVIETWSDAPTTSPGPEDKAAAKERREDLWAIARRVLSEPQWTALWLYYVEGLAVAEIAQAQQCTTFRVKTALFRARKKLAKHVPVSMRIGLEERPEMPGDEPLAGERAVG